MGVKEGLDPALDKANELQTRSQPDQPLLNPIASSHGTMVQALTEAVQEDDVRFLLVDTSGIYFNMVESAWQRHASFDDKVATVAAQISNSIADLRAASSTGTINFILVLDSTKWRPEAKRAENEKRAKPARKGGRPPAPPTISRITSRSEAKRQKREARKEKATRRAGQPAAQAPPPPSVSALSSSALQAPAVGQSSTAPVGSSTSQPRGRRSLLQAACLKVHELSRLGDIHLLPSSDEADRMELYVLMKAHARRTGTPLPDEIERIVTQLGENERAWITQIVSLLAAVSPAQIASLSYDSDNLWIIPSKYRKWVITASSRPKARDLRRRVPVPLPTVPGAAAARIHFDNPSAALAGGVRAGERAILLFDAEALAEACRHPLDLPVSAVVTAHRGHDYSQSGTPRIRFLHFDVGALDSWLQVDYTVRPGTPSFDSQFVRFRQAFEGASVLWSASRALASSRKELGLRKIVHPLAKSDTTLDELFRTLVVAVRTMMLLEHDRFDLDELRSTRAVARIVWRFEAQRVRTVGWNLWLGTKKRNPLQVRKIL